MGGLHARHVGALASAPMRPAHTQAQAAAQAAAQAPCHRRTLTLPHSPLARWQQAVRLHVVPHGKRRGRGRVWRWQALDLHTAAACCSLAGRMPQPLHGHAHTACTFSTIPNPYGCD